uniref:Dynactin subunit 1 n=2 Tax=Schistocephalus solidus TaxID=70667 RepID=A0A0X3Q111_SCHSO
MDEPKLKIGCRVSLIDKNVKGTVAFLGATQFSAGKWVGVVLDEALGKNNGTVQGKRYFDCEENYGIFVRPTQVLLIGPDGEIPIMDISTTSIGSESGSSASQKANVSRLSAPSSIPKGLNRSRSKTPSKAMPSTTSSSRLASSAIRSRPSPSPRRPADEISGRPSSSQPSTDSKTPIRVSSGQSLKASAEKAKPAEKKTPFSGTSTGIQRPSEIPKLAEAPKLLNVPEVPEPPKPTELPEVSTPQHDVSAHVDAPRPSFAPPPAQPATTSQPPTASIVQPQEIGVKSEMLTSPDALIELENLRAEVKDLSEKLEVLKAKRSEDRDKLKELEALKVQHAQLEENRRLMQENSADLQRQVAQLKNEKAQVQAAFDRYRDEMTELAESIEMATLDKEMAEEKLETINLELETLKERVEELTLENQILKDEQEQTSVSPSGDGAPTTAQVKQLEQQNERLKMGLVTFRNLANQDKQEIASLTREVNSLQSEAEKLKKENERLNEELKQSLEHTIELKEQVDAALGADQMVSLLTQKNLELEEKVQQLVEERGDLEALCDMNNELLEGQRDTELELREQVELARSQVQELLRHHEASKETVADYELTLSKFRELVTDLQNQNTSLAQSLADARRTTSQASLVSMAASADPTVSADAASALMQLSGRPGARQPEAQTVAKVIETELRRLDVDQGVRHVELLSAFLPESFNRRAGDHDAILLLLLIDRLIVKCELLSTQVRKRYPLPTCIRGLTLGAPSVVSQAVSREGAPTSPAPVKFTTGDPGPEDEQTVLLRTRGELYSFTGYLVHLLNYWQGLLQQFKCVLNTCNVDLFTKLVTLYNDLSSGHEQSLDRLLDLCKRDQLDESVSLEGILSSITYFVNIHTVQLTPAMQSPTVMDSSLIMSNFARILLAGADSLTVGASCIAVLTGQALDDLDPEEGLSAEETRATFASPSSTGLLGVLKQFCLLGSVIRAKARCIRRRIPANPETQPLSFSPTVAAGLEAALQKLLILSRSLFLTTKNAGQLVATQMNDDAILEVTAVLKECLFPAVKQTLQEAEMPTASLSAPGVTLASLMEGLASVVYTSATAMEHGEYDFDGTKKTKSQEPVILRSIAHRRAQADLESCKGKLELKEEEVRELHVALKMRADELSEMAVRVNLAEKKAESSGKGNLEKIARLEQRLQQSLSEQKTTEKEYEQALGTLQADVEALEKENAELKEKLRSFSKKAIFDGFVKAPATTSSPLSPLAGADTGGGPSPNSSEIASKLAAYRETKFLLNEVEALREAVSALSSENFKLRGDKMHKQVASLRPLQLPHRSFLGKLSAQAKEGSDEVQQPPKANATASELSSLSRRAQLAVQNFHEILATQQLVRLPRPNAADSQSRRADDEPSESPAAQLARQTSRLLQAKNQMEKVQEEIIAFAKTKASYSPVVADFANFVSSSAARKLALADPTPSTDLIGRLTFPQPTATACSAEAAKVLVSPQQLSAILTAILSK